MSIMYPSLEEAKRIVEVFEEGRESKEPETLKPAVQEFPFDLASENRDRIKALKEEIESLKEENEILRSEIKRLEEKVESFSNLIQELSK
ncbi:MAG: hypothetical protein U9N04_02770 [Patescibacteria group bacterium]|nr:hypothetical protein [Patescibacteria group bacterium]